MTAQLIIVSGPPGSGKTDRLLDRYRAVLAEGPPGSVLWLAPTWRAAADVRNRLLGGKADGCFAPGIMPFTRFAESVLQLVPEPIRPISGFMERHLIGRLVSQRAAAGRLEHFGPIAATSGLVDLVCDFISELKRMEIWPEEFCRACDARGMSRKDMELLAIYEAYQRCLVEHNLYDTEGRFWSARDWLERTSGWSPSPPAPLPKGEGRVPPSLPWPHLRLVVADGFTDFTRTQHEILQLLAARVEEMLISLPLEPDTSRADLFGRPRKTLDELRRRHANLTLVEMPRPARPAWPAMAHLERMLFVNPRQAKPAGDATGLKIVAAPRELGEIQWIGEEIKRLLTEGDATAGQAVAPGDIAVVFRRTQDAANLTGEVFGRLGIPFALETGPTLDRSPGLVALVQLLRLDAEDWPMDALLTVLGSNYFRPDWPQWQVGRAAVELAIRRLQIARGRTRLLEGLRAAGGNGGNENQPAADLARLAAALDALPERCTLGNWGRAWQELARETGLLTVIAEEVPGGRMDGVSDRAAWEHSQDALAESDRLAEWLGEDAPQLDRAEALAALVDLLGSQRLGHAHDEAGCVRVLSAASVRALRVPYLFLAGLCEKSFPAPDRQDRLYSEAECQRLIEQGLPLVARSERSGAEMLLFYEAVTRATRRLHFSYPAFDHAAQPLSPSPYLKEVEQACGPGRIERVEQSDLSPVPAGDDLLSAAEFRVKAVAEALEGDVSLLAGLVQRISPLPPGEGQGVRAAAKGKSIGESPHPNPLRGTPGHPRRGSAGRGEGDSIAASLLAALRLIAMRQDRGFGPAEGILPGEAACRQLAARFALDQVFSATELEQYAACPYRFFLGKVLRIEPLEEAEIEADYLERGRLAHELMAAFHRRVNASRGSPTSPAALDADQYQALLDETFREVFQRQPTASAADGLREVDRRVLLRWLAEYRTQHENYDRLWQECERPPAPEFFEVSFGRKLREGDGPPSTAEPLELGYGDETVRISGRIDRIDTGRVAGQAIFNVLDYKTGGSTRFSVEAVSGGTVLQLPIYALAVAELLLNDRDAVPWQAGYWYLRDKGFKPRQALKMYHRGPGRLEPEPEWEEIRELLAQTVAGLAGGIRRGEFPVSSADARCTSYCPYNTICRINHVRSLEKTWLPPAV